MLLWYCRFLSLSSKQSTALRQVKSHCSTVAPRIFFWASSPLRLVFLVLSEIPSKNAFAFSLLPSSHRPLPAETWRNHRRKRG